MHTLDFTARDANYGGNPLRAEGLRIASTLDLDAIDVDVFGGPPGGCGFRSGVWKATFEGETYRFFSSVSHAATLARQRVILTVNAARHIAFVRSGYIKPGAHG